MKGHFRYGYNVAVTNEFSALSLENSKCRRYKRPFMIYVGLAKGTSISLVLLIKIISKKSVPHPVGDALDEVHVEVDSTV